MRAVIQRVHSASVVVDEVVIGSIGHGLLVYLGIAHDDTSDDVAYMVNKVRHLRVFNDDAGKMNFNVAQVAGACLVVSAFTTQGDARKGHRPAYTRAAPPDVARDMYLEYCTALRETGLQVQMGQFQAHMDVSSINDGPICVLVDSKKIF